MHESGTRSMLADAAIASEFDRLAREWRAEARFLSSTTDLALLPSYQQIIGLGAAAVPHILAELQREPAQWFWALRAITRTDPVPAAERGDVAAMTERWLAWGRREGLLPP